ncbi:MAG: SRPBCC family protein [Burkholderiales bacterium]
MEVSRLAEKPSLRIARSYPAAPEKVWRAWTDPQALERWWGPTPGDRVSLAQLDVRPGGRFRIVFGGPQGTDNEVQGIYQEVELHRKLVFTWAWPNSTPERESLVTIVFRAAGGGTELDFRHEQFFDEAARDGHNRGWSAALDSLARFLRA